MIGFCKKNFSKLGEAIPSLKFSEETLVVERRLRCTKEKVGLLSKIVKVIKQEPFSASFR